MIIVIGTCTILGYKPINAVSVVPICKEGSSCMEGSVPALHPLTAPAAKLPSDDTIHAHTYHTDKHTPKSTKEFLNNLFSEVKRRLIPRGSLKLVD